MIFAAPVRQQLSHSAALKSPSFSLARCFRVAFRSSAAWKSNFQFYELLGSYQFAALFIAECEKSWWSFSSDKVGVDVRRKVVRAVVILHKRQFKINTE